METNRRYHGFEQNPHELRSFRVDDNTITIEKHNRKIVRHEPDDIDHFCLWLPQNGVRDVGYESIYNSFLL